MRLRARAWSHVHYSLFRFINCDDFVDELIDVKNFHGSLTTVVRAQNDTAKTANITDTIFGRTYWY